MSGALAAQRQPEEVRGIKTSRILLSVIFYFALALGTESLPAIIFHILCQYDSLHYVSRLIIGGISDIQMCPVWLLLGRHRNEIAHCAFNDSDFSTHRTVVKDNGHVGFD